MTGDSVDQWSAQADIDAYHRRHAFTLPTAGQAIISPLSGIAYTIGEKFAQGSFGDVFACTDEWGHDLVAKVIRPIGDIVQTEARAADETYALALVSSPHIVHVHDAILFRGACYIISERCNLTLREMINRSNANVALWFQPLAKAILHALHVVHTRGLAHCDVHAGNVFLRFIPDALVPKDQAASVFKLGDFGLARPIQTMDPSGTFLEALRPPEARNPDEFGPLDYRADVYQAGLLLLNVLVGREVAFTTEEILEGQPRQLAETLSSKSPPAGVVAVMLRRHVENRPRTALDAWRQLHEVSRKQ
jgi:serine/threonine-protein kinase